MTYDPSRRVFLTRLSKGSLAMALFGVAACGDTSSPTTSTAAPTTTAAPSTTGPATSLVAPTTTLAAPPPTTPPAVPGPVAWERVELVGVSAYLVIRDGEIALVDTGVSGSSFAIETVMTSTGWSWSDMGHVIVTHSHADHAGSLRAVLGFASGATAYAGAADIPDMNSPRPIEPVGDGDSVFDLAIIETPGHTPGHISVLDPLSGVLLAGDALVGGGGVVVGPDASFSDNYSQAQTSVSKLAGFEFETVLFGHGDPVLADGSAQVQAVADSFS